MAWHRVGGRIVGQRARRHGEGPGPWLLRIVRHGGSSGSAVAVSVCSVEGNGAIHTISQPRPKECDIAVARDTRGGPF
jgi:hypothetical protein